MDNRFKLLKIFAVVFKVIAWGALIFGLIGAVGTAVTGANIAPDQPRLGVVGGILFVSVIYFMLFFALSEIIKILFILLENTKK